MSDKFDREDHKHEPDADYRWVVLNPTAHNGFQSFRRRWWPSQEAATMYAGTLVDDLSSLVVCEGTSLIRPVQIFEEIPL